MHYLETESTNPYFNLAFEQYVFDCLDSKNEYFMLWQNDNAVIVGKHQNTFEEVNQKFINDNNVSVVRRLSGGGAVYHDLGNLNFTYITNGGELAKFDFSHFCMPVVETLQELGVPAEIKGRNDMIIDGKKFSGNAQYSKKGRVMHHGTIMFDSNLDKVANALHVSQDKIESKGLKSVHSRVTNVRPYLKNDMTLEEFKISLLEHINKKTPLSNFRITDEDKNRIKELQQNVYGKWEWNYGASPKFAIHKSRRIEGCGKLDIYMDVKSGIIQKIQFYGDYFGNLESDELIQALIGKHVEAGDIYEAISDLEIGQFFNNMTKEQFVSILTE